VSDGGTVVFLHGANMAPESVRATWPAARFVARARVSAEDLPGVVPPGADDPDIWGILVSVPDLEPAGPAVTATTDDGRAVACTPVTQADAIADPAATVAAARYWELPPAYVAALAAAVPAR
jgi:hypothetical protein